MSFNNTSIGVEANDADLAGYFVDTRCATDAVSLQLLDERALGEGDSGLVGPVDVAAEPVLQVLLDEAEAVADAVSLEELVPVVHVPRRVRRHVLGPRAHN